MPDGFDQATIVRMVALTSAAMVAADAGSAIPIAEAYEDYILGHLPALPQADTPTPAND